MQIHDIDAYHAKCSRDMLAKDAAAAREKRRCKAAGECVLNVAGWRAEQLRELAADHDEVIRDAIYILRGLAGLKVIFSRLW